VLGRIGRAAAHAGPHASCGREDERELPSTIGEHPGIFISYRRHDSAGHAGRLFDGLGTRFGQSRIFMDVDGIAPGADFWKRIHEVIDGCAAVLVLIGDEWLSTSGDTGRRLDNPEDFVRQEIAAALERNVMTVPILVNGAKMPAEHELPEDLVPLVRLNALELSDTRWRYDLERLVSAIEGVFATASSENVQVGQDALAAVFVDVPPDDWDRGKAKARRWPWRR
jgi:TIR domain-containing protein